MGQLRTESKGPGRGSHRAQGTSRARVRGSPRGPPALGTEAPVRARFLAVDPYRARREWDRYAGTAQRDLFRELRERFLLRHAVAEGWALDAGSGPGRFTPVLAPGRSARAVALDLSRKMLDELRDRWVSSGPAPSRPDLVVGDAAFPPFSEAVFDVVVGLGNLVGFAGPESGRLLDRLRGLVRPSGRLVLEIAPGPGEHSRYLARLPARSVARLFRSAVPLVTLRAGREGYVAERWRKDHPGTFDRPAAEVVRTDLERTGFRVDEVMAVAPALGPDPLRIAAVATDPKAWTHLVAVEEQLGQHPERWVRAAAVLVAATRVARPARRAECEG